QLLLILLVVAVPCLFMGCAFPVGFRALLATYVPGGTLGRAAGLAAAASSVGNLLGAPLFYLGLWANQGSRACLLLSAAFVAAVTVIVGPSAVARRAGALVLAAVLAVASMSAWDIAILSSGPFLYGPLYLGAASEGQSLPEAIHQRGEVALAIEGPQALVTVRRAMNGALSMQVNGKTDASTTGDMKIQSLIAHLPLLMHSSSRGGVAGNVLVIGLGSGVTVGSALSHPVLRVDVVEISREVLEAASLFEEANRGALHDPRTRVILGDARTHMMFASGPVAPAYDVIASQPSNPWIAGEAILFTREFFELARRRLAPGGILCQWLQGYGLSPEDFRSVVSTFMQVFPHSSLWEESTAGGDYLLLGSDAPLAIDPRRLAEAMGRMSIARDLSRIEVDGPADLLSLFVAEGARLGNLAAGAPIQTQDRLSLEHTAPPA
ncbi:MAG: spermidine synthase, partial [Candidatus Rokuibacteriota bacterium]